MGGLKTGQHSGKPRYVLKLLLPAQVCGCISAHPRLQCRGKAARYPRSGGGETPTIRRSPTIYIVLVS